jgi:hypothetical protein
MIIQTLIVGLNVAPKGALPFKALFVFSTSVPLTINAPNVDKTPNSKSTVVPLILWNIEVSTVPLKFCMAMDQIEF